MLLSGALILASLVPLAVAEVALIARNRRTLETLEEKYLTRSSAATADHIAAYLRRGLPAAHQRRPTPSVSPSS